MKKGKDSFYCRHIKRILDIFCVMMAMIMFSWLYAIVAIFVRINLGSPVLFGQKRPGKDEKIFTLYKFRTMNDATDKDGKLLVDDLRLTRFGRFLRSTSLDELPQAWNILKGDMSVVGPRPLLVEYLSCYTKEERLRHAVRPGLSGWAQINGRNIVTWNGKFKYDLEYVENCSFQFDIKIVLLTIVKTIKRADILVGGQYRSKRLDVERSDKIKIAE